MRILGVSLVRHAPSVHAEGTVPPRDPEAETGNSAAFDALALALPAAATWWVSPMVRSRMTAEALLMAGAEVGDPVYDERLVEQDYGEYHGMAVGEVLERAGDGPGSDWHFLHPGHRPPGGESFAMLHERCRPVVVDMEAFGAGHLVVVCHAMVIRSLLAHVLGLPPEQSLALGVDNLSLTRLEFLVDAPLGATGGGPGGWNGRWRLETLNRVFG